MTRMAASLQEETKRRPVVERQRWVGQRPPADAHTGSPFPVKEIIMETQKGS